MDLGLFAYAFLFTISFYTIVISMIYAICIKINHYGWKQVSVLSSYILGMMLVLVLYLIKVPNDMIFALLGGMLSVHIVESFYFDNKIKFKILTSHFDVESLIKAREKVQREGEDLSSEKDTH